LSTPSFADILADPLGAPLVTGRETAMELGLSALEHLEGTPTARDVRALVTYAARHDESSPVRDAILGVVLNASGTLPPILAERARGEVMRAEWGEGRETAGLVHDPDVGAVPRRQAFAERLLAERARRLRPQMHAFVATIFARGAATPAVPSWFLEKNWVDLRDTLVKRVRHEPMHREVIARWHAAQAPPVQARLQPVEEALVEVATQAILHTPLRAPLAPFCGTERVAEGVRTAVNFRGEPARERLAGYLARLTPGTPWYETIRAIVDPGAVPGGGG
jgi:hypothetical protein